MYISHDVCVCRTRFLKCHILSYVVFFSDTCVSQPLYNTVVESKAKIVLAKELCCIQKKMCRLYKKMTVNDLFQYNLYIFVWIQKLYVFVWMQKCMYVYI